MGRVCLAVSVASISADELHVSKKTSISVPFNVRLLRLFLFPSFSVNLLRFDPVVKLSGVRTATPSSSFTDDAAARRGREAASRPARARDHGRG